MSEPLYDENGIPIFEGAESIDFAEGGMGIEWEVADEPLEFVDDIIEHGDELPLEFFEPGTTVAPKTTVPKTAPKRVGRAKNFKNTVVSDDIITPLSSAEGLDIVENIGREVGPLETRGLNALDETMGLIANVSSKAKSNKATSAASEVIASITPVLKSIKSSTTTSNIIKSMKEAQMVTAIGSMSRGKQIGLAAGSLAAIGAVSNRSLNKRRR